MDQLNGFQKFLFKLGWYGGHGIEAVLPGNQAELGEKIVDTAKGAVNAVKAATSAPWLLIGGAVLILILLFRR